MQVLIPYPPSMLSNMNTRVIIIALVAVFTAVSASAAGSVSRLLSKNEEIKLKQENAQSIVKPINMIGIFGAGFENEAETAKKEYGKEYGAKGYQSIVYKGFTLVVPPGKTDSDIESAKRAVDDQLIAQSNKTPSSEIQREQIAKIRNVFSIQGDIEFDPFIGAYTDDKGFQYNFKNGLLIGKQVGVSERLLNKFWNAFPHLKSESNSIEKMLTNEEIIANVSVIIEKLLGTEKLNNFKQNMELQVLEGGRVALAQKDGSIRVMADQKTGEVIYFSLVN